MVTERPRLGLRTVGLLLVGCFLSAAAANVLIMDTAGPRTGTFTCPTASPMLPSLVGRFYGYPLVQWRVPSSTAGRAAFYWVPFLVNSAIWSLPLAVVALLVHRWGKLSWRLEITLVGVVGGLVLPFSAVIAARETLYYVGFAVAPFVSQDHSTLEFPATRWTVQYDRCLATEHAVGLRPG